MNKLLLTLILHRPKPKNDQGFSLFEVSIAILVSSAFLMGTLQAMTINAVMRVKSERKAQANFLIQQDIEKLQAAASNMELDHIKKMDSDNDMHPRDLNTDEEICYYFNRHLDLEDVRLGAYLVRELDYWLDTDPNPKITSYPAIDDSNWEQVFSSAPTFKQFKTDEEGNVLFTNKTPVLNDKKDSVDGTNKTAIVQVVRDEESLLNKDYRLVRIMTVDSSTDYSVLQVYYRVGEPYDENDPNQEGTDQDGDQLRDDQPDTKSIIAENYTEVIPAAVAECGFSVD